VNRLKFEKSDLGWNRSYARGETCSYVIQRRPEHSGGYYVTVFAVDLSIAAESWTNSKRLAVAYANQYEALTDEFKGSEHGHMSRDTVAYRNACAVTA